MGKDLYIAFSEAKEIFDKADKILGFDLKGLCFEGPLDKLSSTAFSQPAIFVTSIAALRSLEARAKNLEVEAALGLSLGEYSALASANAISFEDGLRLVASRGRFMEEASSVNPGKMASVLGFERAAMEEVCREAGCEIANLNCPGQIVISGRSDAVERAIKLAGERGAKRSMMLDVSGPFHSSLMKPAADNLKTVLDKIEIKRPSINVIANVDASYENDADKIRKNLLSQLTNRTYWEDSIRFLVSKGIKIFFEIGPGKVLKGLLRRIDPGLIVYNAGTDEEIKILGGLA